MIASTTDIPTSKAANYLQQMCRHFGHKAVVTQSENAHTIQFGFGTGEMRAADDVLTLTAWAEDEDTLERLETVLGSHLERFAFRENLIVSWSRS